MLTLGSGGQGHLVTTEIGLLRTLGNARREASHEMLVRRGRLKAPVHPEPPVPLRPAPIPAKALSISDAA